MRVEYKLHFRHKLPHYQPRDSVYFVTFRLAFSLPQTHKNKYNIYKAALEKQIAEHPGNHKLKHDNQKRLFAYYDNLIDEIPPDINLTDNPTLAKVVSDKLMSRHNKLYYLYAFTVMPNHVHFVLKPLKETDTPVPISQIMHGIKGSSAYEINRLCHRKGILWLREYFDYLVRSEQELINIIDYIRYNPVKAGLAKTCEEWQWTWLNPDLLS